LQLLEQQSAFVLQTALLPPHVTHWSNVSSQPCPGHGSDPAWQLPPLQVSAPLQNCPSSQSPFVEQLPPPPQDHPLWEQAGLPHAGRSPSQQ